jgi:hypothetical protein
MSDATKLIDLALKVTKQHYKENPDVQLPPMVYAVKNDQIESLMELSFDNDFAKSMSIAATDLLLKQNGCDASVFISEAWMRVAKDEDDITKGPQPMNSPDRIEMLLVEVSTAEHYILGMFKMIRDKRGMLKDLEQYERYDSKDVKQGMQLKSRFDFFAGLESTREKLAKIKAGREKV